MKVWITRPSIWDCMVKGVGRCELWFLRPSFDMTPRGETDIKFYAHLPKGWVALDDSGLDARGTCSIPVGKLLDHHMHIAQKLWDAIGVSIEGCPPSDGWDRRWDALDLAGDTGHERFLFECELPPDLWFKIALFNGAENGTWGARRYREMLAADAAGELPF